MNGLRGWILKPAMKDLLHLGSHGFTQFLMSFPDGQVSEIERGNGVPYLYSYFNPWHPLFSDGRDPLKHFLPAGGGT